MSSVGVFIISWAGMHERAVEVAKEVRNQADQATVIYSDPDPHFAIDGSVNSIRRPNHLFWGDKFATCVANSGHDVMLVIHADCSATNWSNVVFSCRDTMQKNPRIAVWAPLIEGASYDLDLVKLMRLPETPLWIVADTDGIVFALSRQTVLRMRNARYDKNIYGWGISAMFSANAFSSQSYVIIDTSVTVSHPLTRGRSRAYPEHSAWTMRGEFLKQLNDWEVVQHALLWSHIQKNKLLRQNALSRITAGTS